ncbi:anthrone oxygenase family protein [Rhodococcus sp. HNM0569]|uniref:anthrone oxygenase family protein n=1 Tax=Rhodococcus sp. HNM0569 TaxID=2716340 RepID=UPI00146E5983|nr:anthrone oxygenase family protein [Rhodococcus sp. HNM0569]NLU82592.1 DUF1772 domain-containing protein [Rhodococcus sp. HNM0569]
MTFVLAVLAVSVLGLMVGVEFAVAFVVNPIVLRLPFAAAMAARADGARMLGRVMPFWYFGSLALSVALAAVAWGTGSGVAALVAAVLLAASVALSIGFLVPINNRQATWTADEHPDDWREQYQRWDRLHYLRLAIILSAFVLVAVAATAL